MNNEEGKHKLPKVVDDDQLKVKKQRLDTNQLTGKQYCILLKNITGRCWGRINVDW